MLSKYKISNKLYDSSYIEKTIIEFKDVANIQFINNELILEGENESEINELFNEFMNYVIYLINE